MLRDMDTLTRAEAVVHWAEYSDDDIRLILREIERNLMVVSDATAEAVMRLRDDLRVVAEARGL